jgi:Spy/CpxP family protein refolding chaperone
MKKLLLMIFLAGSVAFAQAQTQKAHKTPEQKAQRMTKALEKKLALSANQSAKVNAILLKKATSMDSLKANHSKTDHKLNRQAIKSILVSTDAQLKTVLTTEQQTTYAGLKASFKGRMHGKRGGHKAIAPEQKAQRMSKVLQQKLTLSEDQYTKVNAILLKRATQMDSLKANHSKTDRKANHESRKAIMTQTDADLKTVLTADQQKTYTELKAQFKDRMKNRRAAKAPTAG